jgi:hypothetical protein
MPVKPPPRPAGAGFAEPALHIAHGCVPTAHYPLAPLHEAWGEVPQRAAEFKA